MKPGTIAGIVVPILLLPILLVFIYVMCKTAKKRDRQGGREAAIVYCEYHACLFSAIKESNSQDTVKIFSESVRSR